MENHTQKRKSGCCGTKSVINMLDTRTCTLKSEDTKKRSTTKGEAYHEELLNARGWTIQGVAQFRELHTTICYTPHRDAQGHSSLDFFLRRGPGFEAPSGLTEYPTQQQAQRAIFVVHK